MQHEPDEPKTETVETKHGPQHAEAGAKPDVVSDPALDDRVGSEWQDEGGADPEGPATATREQR